MLIRMQNNVPETYVNQSRDFQLLCRLYDVVMNGVKYNIDALGNITDNAHIQSNLLSLLQTKVGFFEYEVTDDKLRYLLDAFPYIMKNKGSLKGIEQALNVYLKMNHINTPVQVFVNTQDCTINVIIKSNVVLDTKIIEDVVNYVIPTGYSVEYHFVVDMVTSPVITDINQEITKYKLTQYNSIVRGGIIGDDANRFANAVDTVQIVGDDFGEIGSSEIDSGDDSQNTAKEWGQE